MSFVKTIMVPTDFSQNSTLALQHAVKYAQIFNAAIYLVYVLPELTGKLGEIMKVDPKKLFKEAEERCGAYFQEQIDELPEDHGVAIKTKVLVGVPFKQLLKFQKKADIDLIVIRAKGESAIEEVIFGGTSLKIIRYAECPTLLVRKPNDI